MPTYEQAMQDFYASNRRIDELERELAIAEKELRIAAGLISTMPQFSDKHPEDVLQFIRDAAMKEWK